MRNKRLWIGVCALIVICFAAYLVSVYSVVHPAFDDFGYLCLSYPFPVAEYSSQDYTLMDAVRYAIGPHYQGAQGRVSFLILALGINSVFGLLALKMTFVASILAVCVWTAAQVKKKNGLCMAAVCLLSCVFWGLIGPYVQGNGSYWIAAAWYYLLPFPFFLLLYHLMGAKTPSSGGCAVLFMLSLMLGNALEQWFVLVFSFAALKTAHDKVEGKPLAADVCVLAGCLLGGAILLGSPASWNRMSSGEPLGFVERFAQSGINVVDSFFFTRNTWFLLAFFLSQFVLPLLQIKREAERRVMPIVHLAGTIAVTGLLVRTRVVHGAWTTFAQDWGGSVTAGLFAYWLLCMVQTIRWHVGEGHDARRPMLTFAAYASIGCMALFPHLSGRAYLIYMMLSFVDMLDIFMSAFYTMRKKTLMGMLAAALAGLCVISVRDMTRTQRNISRNHIIFEANDAMLKAAAEEESNETIHLYDYPFKEYTAFMDSDYEKALMRYYYGVEHNRGIVHDLDYWELID